MKIDVTKIPPGGWTISETLTAKDLDLDTELIRFVGPLKLDAEVSSVTNAVMVHVNVSGCMSADCSRCLENFAIDLQKSMELNYQADKAERFIDLNPDIREEIILDYPLKALCNADCKGLCPRCGSNLNKEACKCKA